MTLVYKPLIGAVISKIDVDKNRETIHFHLSNGSVVAMYHDQWCCEQVYIEDIVGDLDDLLDSPVLMFEVVTNNDNPKEDSDSHTWTFYKIATAKGYVTIRWYGESNGYYSEEVEVVFQFPEMTLDGISNPWIGEVEIYDSPKLEMTCYVITPVDSHIPYQVSEKDFIRLCQEENVSQVPSMIRAVYPLKNLE